MLFRRFLYRHAYANAHSLFSCEYSPSVASVKVAMGQHSAPLLSSPTSLQWDGKCQNCRKLMSRCMCFRESEGDADPLTAAATQEVTDASEIRPLWNALRKMHRKAASQPSTDSRKHSEALPPLSASRRLSHRPQKSYGRASREPRREPSPERRKSRLQLTSSSHNLKRDANKDSGIMRSIQLTSSRDKQRTVSKEMFSYEPQGSEEDEGHVWEL